MQLPTHFTPLFLFAALTIAKPVIVQVDHKYVKLEPLDAWLPSDSSCGWFANATDATAKFIFRGSESLSIQGGELTVVGGAFEATINGEPFNKTDGLLSSLLGRLLGSSCDRVLFEGTGLNPETEYTVVLRYVGGLGLLRPSPSLRTITFETPDSRLPDSNKTTFSEGPWPGTTTSKTSIAQTNRSTLLPTSYTSSAQVSILGHPSTDGNLSTPGHSPISATSTMTSLRTYTSPLTDAYSTPARPTRLTSSSDGSMSAFLANVTVPTHPTLTPSAISSTANLTQTIGGVGSPSGSTLPPMTIVPQPFTASNVEGSDTAAPATSQTAVSGNPVSSGVTGDIGGQDPPATTAPISPGTFEPDFAIPTIASPAVGPSSISSVARSASPLSSTSLESTDSGAFANPPASHSISPMISSPILATSSNTDTRMLSDYIPTPHATTRPSKTSDTETSATLSALSGMGSASSSTSAFAATPSNNGLKSSSISQYFPNEATPTSPSSNTTSLNNHPNEHHKSAVIIGSAIGGLAATGLLLGVAHAFTNPAWVGYVLTTISTALGIGAAYHTRRLIIKWRNGTKLPLWDIKIALFITTSEIFNLHPDVVVWQASIVNARNDSFEVDIPCKRGKTRLFFGTYLDDPRGISVVSYEEAPAVLEDVEGQGTTSWRHSSPAGVGSSITAENRTSVPTGIVVGTGSGSGSEGDEKLHGMTPFLRIPEEAFQNDQIYKLEDPDKLYIHAFRVNSDCQLGQSGNVIPNSSQMLEDELTKSNPIEINSLKPLTTWNITARKNGALFLKLASNDKKDKKKYNHECVIDSNVQREGDREALV